MLGRRKGKTEGGGRRRGGGTGARGKAAKPGPVGPPPNVRRRQEPSRKAEPAAPKPTLRERWRAGRARARELWGRARRPAVIAGKALLVAVVVAGSIAVGRLVEKHLRTSPAFATTDIALEGQERLTREELLAKAGLAVGQNVFEIAPEDAQARLSRHPWIAGARVERRLPGSYSIRVRERHAAALLAVDGTLYLVSEEGTVFKKLGSDDPGDLPVITGVERERFVRDETWRASVLLEVVALLHDYRGAGLWRREPISEVHVEADDSLSLYVGDDATLVRLGRGPYRRKLRKLRRVLDRLEQRESRPAYVYLDNVRRPDRVTVKIR